MGLTILLIPFIAVTIAVGAPRSFCILSNFKVSVRLHSASLVPPSVGEAPRIPRSSTVRETPRARNARGALPCSFTPPPGQRRASRPLRARARAHPPRAPLAPGTGYIPLDFVR